MTDEKYEQYKKAIARIYRSDGAVVGSGFLVFDRHILTCAHVVADALGIEHTTQDCPGGLVELDFPLTAGVQKRKIKAEVVFWKPISPSGTWVCGDDIAGLKLKEDLTEEISAIGLVLGTYSWNKFKVLGFPVAYDDGVWTTGELRDELGNGQVQMVVLEQSDYYVEGGFSGAPIWVDTLKGVGGIMVAAEPAESEKRKLVKASFMIPAKVLSEFWCDLKPCILETNKSLLKVLPFPQPLVAQPSFHQKVAELFCLLDYGNQEQEFKDAIAHYKEGAFLLRAKEARIQHWLMRRLAGCVPDFEQAKKFSFRVRSHRMRSDFDAFWQDFKQELGDNLNREMVIKGLANLCQQKSIIIAVYDISSLGKEKIREFYAFWSDLVNQVSSIPVEKRYFRSRLVLLLAEKNSSMVLDNLHPFNFIEPSEINHPQYSISLTPLEKISQQDVESWLAHKDVYPYLNLSDDEIQSIVINDISNWQEEPSEILEDICYAVFKAENGISDIDPYWKLAG
ncbi:MAG: trypsin-like peptidase domain-containing protein [Nostoc sp.]|uniref:trypsin-like peptidase domain-containing protein n=1 Tax=Nostoc sp. TaxID=1180 RepID=UPI002FF8B67C